MKIIDVKGAIIGTNIVIRVMTDKGIDGFAEVESNKDFLLPLLPYYKNLIIGCDPTDINAVMWRIRRGGGFKPWGKLVSTIEMALWDIAGKEAGLPVYKLLGGKVRSKVRVYNGSFRNPNPPYPNARTPEQAAENILALHERPEGFTIVKSGGPFHGYMFEQLGWPEYAYNTYPVDPPLTWVCNKGSLLTEKALDYFIDYIMRIHAVVKGKVGMAYDVGPGMTAVDALRLAKAVEPCKLMWLEDTVEGDGSPSTRAHVYRDITMNTTTPIHTGEQIYLRENYRELIETQAVNVIGPDPADVGGIAELKWIAEYADLHGILIAPHGTIDGIFGMAALTHVCATMPQNYIAYEYPAGRPEWWYDIVDGLPDPLLRDGHVTVWDNPGLGVTFNVNKTSKYLREEDKDFFLG